MAGGVAMVEAARKLYKRMQRQSLVVVLLAGWIPLAIVVALGVHAAQRDFDASTRNQLETLVLGSKSTIQLLLDEKLRQLQLVAESGPVSRLAEPGVLQALGRDLQRIDRSFIDLGLIDDQGRHLAYAGPYDLANQGYGDAAWFRDVKRHGSCQSDVFLGHRNVPHMVVAIRHRDQGHDYILRATVDVDLLSALLRQAAAGTDAELFILNRAGEFQTRSSLELPLMTRAAVGPIPQHPGVRVVASDRGARHEYVATTWLRGGSWVLVARQSAPGLGAVFEAEPTMPWLVLLLAMAVPVAAVLMARLRARQLRALEASHAAQIESAAQGQKMATLCRMAASVAHELRGPLSVIEDDMSWLRARLDDGGQLGHDAEVRRHFDRIAQQVDRSRRVAHGLVAFSRRIGPQTEFINVEDVLDEALRLFESSDAPSVRLVRHYAPEVPPVHSNLAQTQQVLLTLVNSALDAVGDQGEVHLHVEGSGLGVAVRIQDDGPGIPAEELGHVFEPFLSTTSEHGNCRGLGLASCREVMRNLGGRLDVTSVPGRGTTFSLWFPADSATR
jgi:two-component system NtrC family sensor kinase